MDTRPVVLSLEQALSMSHATLRMVHLGWRVIRVEPTPLPGRKSKGDPNRYIGRPVAGEDRHSYYVGPNVGKEAIAINLKSEEGQRVLRRLISELPVDVFCTNTMPGRHAGLGITYERLREQRDELIWCCISAMGLANPEVPGYDPVLQAQCGYMDLTGPRNGPPTLCGPPIIDLKAGDEAFTQVILAMWQRAQGAGGRCIDISMARAAVSWLHTFLPMLDMDSPPEELRRSGNEHRQFIPVNAYRTSDGYIYIAIGSDAQWHRLVSQPLFASLDQERFTTNESRRAEKVVLFELIGEICCRHATERVAEALRSAAVPHAPITSIEGVLDLPFVAESGLETIAPDGRVVRLPPAAVETAHLQTTGSTLPFAPTYGEHTSSLLSEIGFGSAEVADLLSSGAVA
ncbi:MAG: CoA transferase [Deltaproteobacteria bacterium]|nr:CoA transferase [Deltaproteobacteria bacterium]